MRQTGLAAFPLTAAAAVQAAAVRGECIGVWGSKRCAVGLMQRGSEVRLARKGEFGRAVFGATAFAMAAFERGELVDVAAFGEGRRHGWGRE